MKIRREGEIMPAFYYGLGYKDYIAYTECYFIIPFNYFIRWKRYIHNWWRRNVQHRETWFDKEIREMKRLIHSEYGKNISSSNKECDRYRNAYYECLSAMLKSNVPRETIDRLHKL